MRAVPGSPLPYFWGVLLQGSSELPRYWKWFGRECTKMCAWRGALWMHAESRFARNCSSQLQLKSEIGQVDRRQVSETSSLRHQPKVAVPLDFITGFFWKGQPSPNPLPHLPFDFNLVPFVFNPRWSNFKVDEAELQFDYCIGDWQIKWSLRSSCVWDLLV